MIKPTATEQDKTEQCKTIERSLLGCILIDGKILGVIAGKLDPNRFKSNIHADICRAMLSLNQAGKEIDITTVSTELQAINPNVDPGYLANLIAETPNSNHYQTYLDQWTKKTDDLNLSQALRSALTTVQENPGIDPSEVLKPLLETIQHASKYEPVTDGDYLSAFYDEIQSRHVLNSQNKFVGLTSGFKHLDEVTLGIQTGLWVILAKPSLGKTTFVKQLADQVVMNNPGVPCLFVSYEQSQFELILKTITRFSGINSRKIQKGRISETEQNKLVEAIEAYQPHAKNMFILEASNADTTTAVIESESRRIMAERKADKILVILDYLQLIPASNGGKNDTDKMRVDRVLSELRRMARSLNSPIITVSSSNRSGYTDNASEVTMASGKESGGIEYTADIVATMNPTNYQEGNNHEIKLKIEKNRNGERGAIFFSFNPQTATFTEKDKQPEISPEIGIDWDSDA